jgi:hypothetical protein
VSSRPQASVTPYVVRYFQEHQGSDVWIDDLLAYVCERNAIPLRPSLKGSVQTSVSQLIAKGKLNAEVTIRGQHWIVSAVVAKPPKVEVETEKHLGKMLEVIRELKDGSLLLECEDGRLYKAQEVVL